MDFDVIQEAALSWSLGSRTELLAQLRYSLKGLSAEGIESGEDLPPAQREEVLRMAEEQLGKFDSDLPREMLSLPVRERDKLAAALIRSLAGVTPEDIAAEREWEEELRIEIERRVREADEGKVKSIPWEEVKKKGRELLDELRDPSLSGRGLPGNLGLLWNQTA